MIAGRGSAESVRRKLEALELHAASDYVVVLARTVEPDESRPDRVVDALSRMLDAAPHPPGARDRERAPRRAPLGPGRVERCGRQSTNPVPRQILVPVLPPNADELETWLCGLRGSRVAVRVPKRGDKRALAETVKRNAQDALTQHKLKRAGDFTARSAALQSIQEALGLADAPLRIECVDISHVQGTDVVASLVVFEDEHERLHRPRAVRR